MSYSFCIPNSYYGDWILMSTQWMLFNKWTNSEKYIDLKIDSGVNYQIMLVSFIVEIL